MSYYYYYYYDFEEEVEEESKDCVEQDEIERRIAIRAELTEHNKSLAMAAENAGVTKPRDFGIFQNKGYEGLYGGLNKDKIHERKGLKKSHKILDYMGSTELAANLFRATQTEEKLIREQIQGKVNANRIHFEVGQKVRETIKDLGGTMPEDLPTPDKGIKQVKNELSKKSPS